VVEGVGPEFKPQYWKKKKKGGQGEKAESVAKKGYNGENPAKPQEKNTTAKPACPTPKLSTR
jgi:hypothetical protein